MKHYREIDILRGIAIIMVFLGHAVIVYPINLENVAWCRGLVAFISAVHMPLFFIVAGFCFHRKSTYVDMVHKKIKRLLVPYVIFNLFDMCCRLVLSKFVNRPCGIRESMIKMLFYGGEYWFLYVLFLMCILWGGILPYVKKHVWLQVIVGIAAVVLNVLQISFDVCKVDSLCRFFVFFMLVFDSNSFRSFGLHEESDKKYSRAFDRDDFLGWNFCTMVSEWMEFYPGVFD